MKFHFFLQSCECVSIYGVQHTTWMADFELECSALSLILAIPSHMATFGEFSQTQRPRLCGKQNTFFWDIYSTSFHCERFFVSLLSTVLAHLHHEFARRIRCKSLTLPRVAPSKDEAKVAFTASTIKTDVAINRLGEVVFWSLFVGFSSSEGWNVNKRRREKERTVERKLSICWVYDKFLRFLCREGGGQGRKA